MKDSTSVVELVVEEPNVSVNVDMQRIADNFIERLPHPVKIGWACAAVL